MTCLILAMETDLESMIGGMQLNLFAVRLSVETYASQGLSCAGFVKSSFLRGFADGMAERAYLSLGL